MLYLNTKKGTSIIAINVLLIFKFSNALLYYQYLPSQTIKNTFNLNALSGKKTFQEYIVLHFTAHKI